MRRRGQNQRGQSILEYLIVVAAIILALAAFGSKMGAGVEAVGDDAQAAIEAGGAQVAGISPVVE